MSEQGCLKDGEKLKRKYIEQVTLVHPDAGKKKKKNVTFNLQHPAADEGIKKKRVTLLQVDQKVEKLLERMNFNPTPTAVKREEHQLGEVNQKLDNILQMTSLKIRTKADKILEINQLNIKVDMIIEVLKEWSGFLETLPSVLSCEEKK